MTTTKITEFFCSVIIDDLTVLWRCAWFTHYTTLLMHFILKFPMSVSNKVCWNINYKY